MKIMAPTAGTKPAKENVKYIVNIAKRLGADLLALHIQTPGHKKADEKALDVFNEEGKKAGVRVWQIMWAGGIVQAIKIAAEKEGVDLILIGANKDDLRGKSISSSVAKETTVPVVVIPCEHI